MAVALLDYNMGNLGSVRKALEFVGAGVEVVESGAGLAKFGCCILPGVGNFGDGMENLKRRGFDRAIPEFLARGGYFFGVCLGMQMLLESSEEQMAPAKYKKALEYLKDAGVFAAVSGVLVGRPMDGVWQAEYEQLLRQVIDDPALPVVCGLNVGHALPRCIVPLGVPARVDVPGQKIEFL